MSKRIITASAITEAVTRAAYSANYFLPDPVEAALRAMRDAETEELAGMTLDIIIENAGIAKREKLPLCQDCGTVIVFLEIGQDVSIEGKPLYEAVNEGIETAYREYYLRKSIVGDPLRRANTGTNTPCAIHADIVSGDRIAITVYLKGGGSENMTRLKMFNPTAAVDEIIDFTASSVIDAGPNPCPPLFLGVGIGGTADTALVNAKKAVLRDPRIYNADPFYADIERRIEERLAATGIGPLGFGGRSTAVRVFIKPAPTHIATLPVALNLNCHSLRYGTEEL